jgi:transposase InsO family protein
VQIGGPDRLSSSRRKRYYQFTAIDDCTRIRVLKIFERNTQASAIQFIDYVFEKLPFRVEVVQTDNGAEFGSRFHYHVLDAGVGHVHIKPSTPRLNGKVERSHRMDAEEFYRMLEGVVIDDTEMFNDKLREWEDFYNFSRPHGSLGGQTPYERLRQKTQGPDVTSLRQLHIGVAELGVAAKIRVRGTSRQRALLTAAARACLADR